MAAKTPKQLSGFISYLLGRRPDEFGLVPDEEGFVAIKELLQVFAEEEGWRHVRRPLIDELMITMQPPPVEVRGSRIRAVERDHLAAAAYAEDPPKLLYAGITPKSYPVVAENGILPTRHQHVVLAARTEMAERIAGRRTPEPVLLTVNTAQLLDRGIVLMKSGSELFLADHVPPGCFSGPPLPKEKPDAAKKADSEPKSKNRTPGSFYMDIGRNEDGIKKRHPKEKPGSWKRDKKRIRRQQQKDWPD